MLDAKFSCTTSSWTPFSKVTFFILKMIQRFVKLRLEYDISLSKVDENEKIQVSTHEWKEFFSNSSNSYVSFILTDIRLFILDLVTASAYSAQSLILLE